MKLESLVIADQNAAVNEYVPGLVHTARHTMESKMPEVGDLTKEGAAEGRFDNWGEVVTR